MRQLNVIRKTYLILLIIFILLLIGVGGYVFIEGYTLLEAIYMTVLALSTVGFNEVRPLSPVGQIFTSVLIVSSFGIFAYGLSVLTKSLLSGELTEHLKQRRLKKEIANLNNHVIVCGFGRNGRRAARKLIAYGQEVLVLENDPEVLERYSEAKDYHSLLVDATSDEGLKRAGIERAKAIITTLSKDADNLYAVITARGLNPKINIISRAANYNAEVKLKQVGANRVIMPENVGGAQMASLVVSPDLVEFLDHLSVEGDSNVNLEEVEVRQLTTAGGGMQLKDLAIRQKTGCSIIGLKTPKGQFIINPGSELEITPNSKLFVLGSHTEIMNLHSLLTV